MFDTFYEQQKRREHLVKSFTNNVIEPAANLTTEGSGQVGQVGPGMAKACKGMLIKGKFRIMKKSQRI